MKLNNMFNTTTNVKMFVNKKCDTKIFKFINRHIMCVGATNPHPHKYLGIQILGQNELAPTNSLPKMDCKCSRNNIVLGSSSLANHGG